MSTFFFEEKYTHSKPNFYRAFHFLNTFVT